MVDDGWQAAMTKLGSLVLERVRPIEQKANASTSLTSSAAQAVNPVLLEVFGNRFMSIAEQMGWALQNTAQSVNIKERLDFSCALFTPNGDLVANAPHMPVHLGSMGESVKTVIRENQG